MSASEAMAERHRKVLAELTELGLDLARSLKARAEAATTPAEAEGLALAFHRVARSVRQTLALDSKLARERAGIANDERGDLRRAVTARQAQVRAPVVRDVWSEREQAEAEALIDVLEDHLDEAALYPSFLEDPVEAQVAWLRGQLGLPVNDAGPPSFATPPAEAPPAEARRSSG